MFLCEWEKQTCKIFDAVGPDLHPLLEPLESGIGIISRLSQYDEGGGRETCENNNKLKFERSISSSNDFDSLVRKWKRKDFDRAYARVLLHHGRD